MKQEDIDEPPILEHDAKSQPLDNTPEYGGRKGLDPVRFGDWELNGKCVDF
ncbi:MAG: DUF1674 domain-containing protein [Alphaproteobacteria bacterium]|nr:MAG: DUF1674 domain-containing protein [Alphaproteobacteria bacterium]